MSSSFSRRNGTMEKQSGIIYFSIEKSGREREKEAPV
jgi:hypothetical protein